MEPLRKIFDDAPAEIVVEIPPEWRHRRIEVVLCALDRPEPMQPEEALRHYQVLKVVQRVIAARDALHER
jgi:hypothetical protein